MLALAGDGPAAAECSKSTPGTSSTSSCSRLQSPSYDRLDEAGAAAAATATVTPCNDWQPLQLSPSAAAANVAERAMGYLTVEDSSDSESLGSRLVIPFRFRIGLIALHGAASGLVPSFVDLDFKVRPAMLPR